MSETNTEATSPDYLGVMGELYTKSLGSLQIQDLQQVTLELQQGRSLYKQAEKQPDQDPQMLDILKVYLFNIQAIYQLLKASFSKMEEKFQQSYNELLQGKQICTEGKHLLEDLEEDPEWKEFAHILKFMFTHLSCACEAESVEVDYEIKVEQGIWVSQVDMLHQSAAIYRKINDVEISFNNENPAILGLIKQLNRIASAKENKAEKLDRERITLRHLPIKSKKIFLIHGHAEGLLRELRDLLEKKLNLECIIMKEQSNKGDSVIEKFERTAKDCGYAFAILSPDDVVENNGTTYFQARPNVLFEMGWFFGRYGRRNLCIIKHEDTKMPSDLDGIISLEYSKNISSIYLDMEQELKAVGFID
jgi:predicted nucleotide-binding protein